MRCALPLFWACLPRLSSIAAIRCRISPMRCASRHRRPQAALSLDAWVRPPAYTAKPPLLLTSAAIKERLQRDSELLVPESSLLVLRLTGAAEPRLAFFDLIAGEELNGHQAQDRHRERHLHGSAPLDRPAEIRVYDGASELAQWRLSVIPDMAAAGRLHRRSRGRSLGRLGNRLEGVGRLRRRRRNGQDRALRHPGRRTGLRHATACSCSIRLHFPIALKKASPREIDDRTTNDLTAHPWAGLNVDITLEAKDQAGKTGKSETKTVTLPERLFIKPLGQGADRAAQGADPRSRQHPQGPAHARCAADVSRWV